MVVGLVHVAWKVQSTKTASLVVAPPDRVDVPVNSVGWFFVDEAGDAELCAILYESGRFFRSDSDRGWGWPFLSGDADAAAVRAAFRKALGCIDESGRYSSMARGWGYAAGPYSLAGPSYREAIVEWNGSVFSLQHNQASPDRRWNCLDELMQLCMSGQGVPAEEPDLTHEPVVVYCGDDGDD